ncbi:MAG: polysaccharide deacetylase family protein [Planctomycetaceae bacterium]|nr:polysaccharide deacetylase family protein [Planctomycetaceae bacterium]
MTWRSFLLTLYYHASRPARAWCYRCMAAQRRLPAIVLVYHRVADDGATPWTMPSALFVRQMRWLQRHFDLVSLEETQRRIREGSGPRPSVSITFDDGYADNCRTAIPWLVRERVPCTYFVTAQNALTGDAFPHDQDVGCHLPTNTLDQLREMADLGIEIGAHSYTHANLGEIADPESLWREVVAAKRTMEDVLEREVRYFAYPYGGYVHLNREAFRLAEQVGYLGVCSCYGGLNFPGDDPFHLQRIAVGNDMIHLKNWTTMDPRKLGTPRFLYRTGEGGVGHRGDENPTPQPLAND